jgi:hypothetical protein
MTTLTIKTYNGFQVASDQQALYQVNTDEVVDNSSACELPILADGLLYAFAKVISRLVTRVFGETDNSAGLEDLPDYYYPMDCCSG